MSRVLTDADMLAWGNVALTDMLRTLQIVENNAYAAELPTTTVLAAVYGSCQLLLVGRITDRFFVHGGIRPTPVAESMGQCRIRLRPPPNNRLPTYISTVILPQTPDLRTKRVVRSRISRPASP